MDIWTNLQTFLEYSVYEINLGRIAVAIFIFLGIMVLRSIVLKIVFSVFRKVASKTKSETDDKFIPMIEPPIRFFIMVIGLWAAINFLNLSEGPAQFSKAMLRSLFVLTFFWTAYRATDMFSRILKKLAERTKAEVDDQIIEFLSKFIRAAVIILGALVIIQEWGYDIKGLIATLGIGGLAVALAAKDTVANLFGSLTILLDRPFTVGDWIETPNIEGTVEEIHLRTTRIRTFANALVSVPNSSLVNDPITNWSRMKKRRIKYNLGLTCSSTSDQIISCIADLKTMLKTHPEIHPDTVFVYFNSFGESALELFLYFFTKTTNWEKYLDVRQDINLKIMKIIEKNGLSLAFPSTSVYLEKTDNQR